MFCPNCGTQNPETAQTCSKCNFHLKSAAAPKFKGTMLMMNQPGQAPAAPAAPRPAAGGVAPPAPGAAPPSKLKGTMVGVAPPAGGPPQYGAPPQPPQQQYGAPPQPPQQQYGSAPPPQPQYGAPPQQQYGAPPQQQYGAPPGPDPNAYAPPAPPPQQGVNPLGGTMAVDQMPGFGGPFGGAPDPNAGAFGQPPPQQGFGAPPQQYGAPPDPNMGAFGQPQQGFGAPQPGYGAPQQGFGAPQPDYGQPPGYNPGNIPTGMPNLAPPTGPGGMIAAGGMVAGAMAANDGKPKMRNPVMTLVISCVCCLYGLLQYMQMGTELKSVLPDSKFVWWHCFIPIYGYYVAWILLPRRSPAPSRRSGSRSRRRASSSTSCSAPSPSRRT